MPLADLTGDGVVDIVGGAMFADVGGVADTGAAYLWRGGTGLAGTVDPATTMTVPGATAADQLGK